jgi:hypothetical protein
MCHRSDTQLIAIERYTGNLIYTGQPGVDLFENPKDALDSISRGQKSFKSVVYVAFKFHQVNILLENAMGLLDIIVLDALHTLLR